MHQIENKLFDPGASGILAPGRLGIGSHHGLLVNTPKPGVAAWLTGGAFGPDAAVPAMMLGVLINVALWHYAFRDRPLENGRAKPMASATGDV
jgi:deoxyinosine 3'endonuclease (endonuclease V)